MKKSIFLAALLALVWPLSAEEVAEDSIFGQESTVTPIGQMQDDSIQQSLEQESLAFTGFINSRNFYNMHRDWLQQKSGGFEKNSLATYIQSNYSLDARLRQNIRGFVNASLSVYPQGKTVSRTVSLANVPTSLSETVNTELIVNEAFVDVNFRRQVYLRAGKQTLQWGSAYFWNPVDLINVDRKSFLDYSQVRQGTYGLKAHVPFSTRANLYGFIGTGDSVNVDTLSAAGRFEVLLGNTEMSLSATAKKGRLPVFGYDITSRVLGFDLRAELSASYGENKNRLKIETVTLFPGQTMEVPSAYQIEKKWITKVAFGLGKSFELFNLSDRLAVNGELFFNDSGYRQNIFAQSSAVVAYFMQNGLYEPNYYAAWYGAFFITYRQLFHPDLNLSVNWLSNLIDRSAVTSTMLTYTPVYNLTLTLMLNVFSGPSQAEYTYMGSGLSTELAARVVF